jgi:hypothetical protein
VPGQKRFSDVISVAAGTRGLQVLIIPDDDVRVAEAQVAPIAWDKG